MGAILAGSHFGHCLVTDMMCRIQHQVCQLTSIALTNNNKNNNIYKLHSETLVLQNYVTSNVTRTKYTREELALQL